MYAGGLRGVLCDLYEEDFRQFVILKWKSRTDEGLKEFGTKNRLIWTGILLKKYQKNKNRKIHNSHCNPIKNKLKSSFIHNEFSHKIHMNKAIIKKSQVKPPKASYQIHSTYIIIVVCHLTSLPNKLKPHYFISFLSKQRMKKALKHS